MDSKNDTDHIQVWPGSMDSEKWRRVYGNTTAISIAESDMIIRRIEYRYTKIKPRIRPEDKWLFQKSEKKYSRVMRIKQRS